MTGEILVVSGTAWIGDPLGGLFCAIADDGGEIVACFHAFIDGFVPITQWFWMHMGEIEQGNLCRIGYCHIIVI